MPKKRYMTIDEVAAYLRVSRWSVMRYIDAGDLEAVKAEGPKGAVRIPVTGLNDWIKRHTVTANEETR